MTDSDYVAKEHEGQQARFEDFIKNPQAHGTPPPPPHPSPPETRSISFIGRNQEDNLQLDLLTQLGPHLGFYPVTNDAEEVVSMQDTPGYLLSEEQRASGQPLMPPPRPQRPKPPFPTPQLHPNTASARLAPPIFAQKFAMPPAYTRVRTPGPDFDKYKCVRPPANVQPPPNMELGMVEICTFMPDWLMIPEVMTRMMRNGADATILAKIELKAINQLTAANLAKRCAILNKQMSIYGKACFRVPADQDWDIAYARNFGPQNDLTANAGRNSTDQPWGAWRMVEIFSKVPRKNWPKGGDRGLFTQCLEYAAMFPRKELWSAHIEGLVGVLRLQPPPAPATGNRDQLVVSQFSIPDPSS